MVCRQTVAPPRPNDHTCGVIPCPFLVVFIWNGYVDRTDMYRLNIGGKFLTNYLKEVLSYRQYNMMDETYLINKVKESTCYVSQDFSASLENIKNKPKGPSGSGSISGSVSGLREGEVRYVLPDYSHSKEGYVLKEGQTIKEDQQVLVLGNERFAIPELLFTPSDVGNSPLALAPVPGGSRMGSTSGFNLCLLTL
jgi:actin-related protein 6